MSGNSPEIWQKNYAEEFLKNLGRWSDEDFVLELTDGVAFDDLDSAQMADFTEKLRSLVG